MLHGPVMIDLEGPTVSATDRDRLLHPATGGVILFTRNFESPQQVYRLITSIHELRSPHLLVAVDQEGGRVQRFRDGFTLLPAAARYLSFCRGDLDQAKASARELGWLMAAELRAVGVDFSFAPVLDLDVGVSSVIGDRAFGRTREQVAQLAGAWMLGAREAGMISVGKHFPGHGGVAADSHLALPIDERSASELADNDLRPFRHLIDNGLEAIMPAHVVYSACDIRPAGFSRYWLRDVLRDQLHFAGAIFSDDLDMAAAAISGCFADRARAALDAGCDMVLVCNNPDGADEVLDALRDYHDPVAHSRLARLHGRPSVDRVRLSRNSRWRRAVALAERINAETTVDLDLEEPI
jgi:beta-N-acetylhexosaminidase